MLQSKFWLETLERAIKTAAQAGLAFFIVGQTALQEVDWSYVGGVTLIAALVSVLTSLASINVGPKDSPSIVK